MEKNHTKPLFTFTASSTLVAIIPKWHAQSKDELLAQRNILIDTIKKAGKALQEEIDVEDSTSAEHRTRMHNVINSLLHCYSDLVLVEEILQVKEKENKKNKTEKKS